MCYVALSDKKASFRCSEITSMKHKLENRFGIIKAPCVFIFEEDLTVVELFKEHNKFRLCFLRES
jgi:hypothetical protein